MIVVAVLTVRRAALAEFRAYEGFAIGRVRAHGGALERCVEADGPTPELLREVHVLRFPDAAALAAYRADPALLARQAERAAAVVDAQVWTGVDGPTY